MIYINLLLNNNFTMFELKQIRYDPIFEMSNTIKKSREYYSESENKDMIYVPLWCERQRLIELMKSIKNNFMFYEPTTHEYLMFFDINFNSRNIRFIFKPDIFDIYFKSMRDFLNHISISFNIIMENCPYYKKETIDDDIEALYDYEYENTHVTEIKQQIYDLNDFYECFPEHDNYYGRIFTRTEIKRTITEINHIKIRVDSPYGGSELKYKNIKRSKKFVNIARDFINKTRDRISYEFENAFDS